MSPVARTLSDYGAGRWYTANNPQPLLPQGDNLMLAIKILGAIAAVLVVSVVAVGLAMYFRLIPIPGPLLALLIGSKPPEYSARYYPPDTLAYAWLTLAPGDGQINDMQDIWQRFNEYPAFAEAVDEWRQDFTDETGLDFDEDVMSWLGLEIGAAVVEVDDIAGAGMAFDDGLEAWDSVSIAATIGVRDHDAAADFLGQWLAYVSVESYANFAQGSYRGFDTWVDPDVSQAYALTDDWLVFATNEETLQAVLKRIDGDDDDVSLVDDANFKAARAALPERRFTSIYLDYEQALELSEDFKAGFMGMPVPLSLADRSPDWVASSAAWVERGVTMEIVSPAAAGFRLESPELQDPAELLPYDTLGFIAGAFDPNVDNWRKALAEYQLVDVLPYPEMLDEINASLADVAPDGSLALDNNATLSDALDAGFDAVAEATGIDLESDLLDHLAGQGIIAVRDFDFDAVDEDPTANAIDAVAMLSYREESKVELSDTMGEVADLLQDNIGMEARSVDVGAEDDATVFGLGFLGMMMGPGEIGYQPGYVLHNQYLTIGATENALSTIVALQNGEWENLAPDAEYRRAISHLADDMQFLAYVDTNRIISQLDNDDLDLDPDEYRILQEGIGVMALGAASGDDYDRGIATLTLFPE